MPRPRAAVSGDVPASTSVLATEEPTLTTTMSIQQRPRILRMDTTWMRPPKPRRLRHRSTTRVWVSSRTAAWRTCTGPTSRRCGQPSRLVDELPPTRSIAERFPTSVTRARPAAEPLGASDTGWDSHVDFPPPGCPTSRRQTRRRRGFLARCTDARFCARPTAVRRHDRELPSPRSCTTRQALVEPEGFRRSQLLLGTPTAALCVVTWAGKRTASKCFDQEKMPELARSRSMASSIQQRTTFMVDVWTIPANEEQKSAACSSAINSVIVCPDGTYYMVPEVDTE